MKKKYTEKDAHITKPPYGHTLRGKENIMGKRKAGEAAAKGASSLFDNLFERVGTATTRGAQRQKKKKSNVFQRDAKTGQVRSVTRGERVKRGQKVTGGAAAATGAAAAGSAAMADKGGKKESTKVGKMKRGDSVKRTETPKKAGATRGERKQKTSPRGSSVGRGKPIGGTAPGIMTDPSKLPPKKPSKPKTSSKPTTAAKPEKKKDKEKKTILGLEVKPSKNGRFAGRGGKRRRVAGRAMGGMMKSKMASKGGAKGGRRPTGMKDGGSLEMTVVNGRKVPAFAADGKGANDLAKGMRRGGMARDPLARTRRRIKRQGGLDRQAGGRAVDVNIGQGMKKAARTLAGGAGGGPVAGAANMQRLAQQALKGFGGGAAAGRGRRPTANPADRMAQQAAAGRMAQQAAGGRRGRRPAANPASGPMGAMAGAMSGMGRVMPQQQLTAQFMANGGMMKSKGMAKGGAMKKKGYAMGGMAKKGMAKGGPVKKKAVSRKPRGVGAALRGYGKALK